MNRLLRASLATLCIWTLSNCASTDAKTRLDDNLFAYSQAIRWSDYVKAANFIHPDDRPTAQQLEFQLARLQNVKIVGYRELQRQPSSDGEWARQTVELRLLNRHTMGERIMYDEQRWRFDPEANRWWLVSGLPDLTRQ